MTHEAKPTPYEVSSWVHFFQILTMHRCGYSARFSMEATADAQDVIINAMARTLFMVPLPEGDHMKPSALAAEWVKDNAA